jgi:hypothetical protein
MFREVYTERPDYEPPHDHDKVIEGGQYAAAA